MPYATPQMYGKRIARIAALLLFACGAGGSQAAYAGIYNLQSILAIEAPEGLSGAISGAADYRTGNVNYLFLGATPLARYRSGDHLVIGLVRSEYKSSTGDTILSRTFEHLRYRYQLRERLLAEVFAQHEYDGIKRLQLRTLLGAGPKVDLVKDESYGLALGVAYMIEYERLQDDGEIDAGRSDFQHRNSSYLVGHYQLDSRVQLIETVYVQPRLTDVSDTRLLSDSQVTFQITKRLSFATSFSLAYDSRPPATIKRLDTALVSSLTLEL